MRQKYNLMNTPELIEKGSAMVVGFSAWVGSVVFFFGIRGLCAYRMICKETKRIYNEENPNRGCDNTEPAWRMIIPRRHELSSAFYFSVLGFRGVIHPLAAPEKQKATKEQKKSVLFDSSDGKRTDADKTSGSGQN
jgi:hypothetical protein